jgi:hypothetical protein
MSILSTSSKLVRVGDSYSAGEGISIENNTISVTGDYGHAYYPGENISISDDNVISSKDWSSDIDTAVQNASAETTAWVDSQNYLTDADMSDYALITDVETTSGLLKMDIDTVSASITGKMDSTAFNDWQNGQYANDIGGLANDVNAVSGAVNDLSATVEGLDIPTHQEIIDASGYAYSQSTAWTNSQGYLTQHQDISYLATKNEVDTVSSFLSGAIDYVSANAGDEFPASANDAITAYQNASGTYLTSHQSLDGYLTKTSADTLYQPIGSYASQTDLEQVSGDLKGDIDYISGVAITAHQDISNKLDTTAFSTVSGTFLTAVDLTPYATTGDLNTASSFLSAAIDYVSANAGDEFPVSADEAIQYVQTKSATIDDINSTVQTNSAQWAEGTSVDTIPVAVISPLVTGFSGESAYLGIESTALNLSSYVPVSSIGVNPHGYISGISGMNISAYTAGYAAQADYANIATQDSNYNLITSYYQPKLTISGDAGTITSINGSAVGASIPEGWELVAGQGIEIVDDAENNQTTISVTAAGGNPEVESYVQSNSASIDDAVSTYQTNSGSYITQETDWTNTITAASSYAYSEAVAQIPAPFDPTYMSGAIDYISGVAITALPGDLATTGDINDLAQSISETYQPIGNYLSNEDSANFYPMTGNPSGFLTSHQDISNKLDTTAFSDVSGTFLTAVNIPESANWNDATTAYQTNSGDYLKESELGYNAVDEVSAINGSAISQYGAEKQWLVHDDTLVHASNSAQYALGVNLSAIAQLLGVSGPVLNQETFAGYLNGKEVYQKLFSGTYTRTTAYSTQTISNNLGLAGYTAWIDNSNSWIDYNGLSLHLPSYYNIATNRYGNIILYNVTGNYGLQWRGIDSDINVQSTAYVTVKYIKA